MGSLFSSRGNRSEPRRSIDAANGRAAAPTAGGADPNSPDVFRVSLGAGCYWGTEKYVRHNFLKHPQTPQGEFLQGNVGFMGPKSAPKQPSYEDVCTGRTGHVEVYDCSFKAAPGEQAALFKQLIKFFFMFHDPTTLNRQGNDTGTQYASVIYCYTESQYELCQEVKKELQTLLNEGKLGKKVYQSVRISTDIRMVEAPFFAAHKEHQDYLMKNPNGYCNHRMRFNEWPEVPGNAM